MKPNQSQIAKSGFTLVELLLVMAIIGVLSSLALVVVNEAQYDARVSATQSRINMLDQIMRQKMEQIQERRMPIEIGSYAINRRGARELRKRYKADILDVEMPRLMWDIAYERSTGDDKDFTFPSRQFSKWILADVEYIQGGPNERQELIELLANNVPANALRFRFDFDTNYNFDISDDVPQTPPDTNLLNYPDNNLDERPFTFNPADPTSLAPEDFDKLTTASEYLYLILQSTQFNGISAIEAMGNRAVGNTDGDEFLEIVDSWGTQLDSKSKCVLTTETGIREALSNPMI